MGGNSASAKLWSVGPEREVKYSATPSCTTVLRVSPVDAQYSSKDSASAGSRRTESRVLAFVIQRRSLYYTSSLRTRLTGVLAVAQVDVRAASSFSLTRPL